MDTADNKPVDESVDSELDKPVQGLDEPGDEEGALLEEELKLPEPIPDVPEEDRLEEQIRNFTREAASETLRRCGELLQRKPERALNLIELYVHASRKFLVELAEPEAGLSRAEGRIPLPVLGATQNIDIGNGYQLGGALHRRGGNRYHNEQLLQEAHEGLLRREEEHPLIPLARTYAQGLRMVLARASAMAMGPEALDPMMAAVKESLGEELSEELLGAFSPPRFEAHVPCTPEEAAGDLSEEPRPFEELLDEQELVFEPDLPEEIQISEIPSFDELLEEASFKMNPADIDIAEGDLDAIDRALDEDDEEEAEDAEEGLEEAGLGLAGGDRKILRQLQRQVRRQRREMNRLIPNPYRNPLYR